MGDRTPTGLLRLLERAIAFEVRSRAPLFLLDNWIQRTAPDRADAAQVNRRAFIVERARRCGVARGELPNFIAVDFFTIGDILGAVDDLNGVSH
jgi:hypothetical protein